MAQVEEKQRIPEVEIFASDGPSLEAVEDPVGAVLVEDDISHMLPTPFPHPPLKQPS